MTTAISKLAERFALGNAAEAAEILKATAFKGPATDAQLTALCVVAQQYGLNPFTRELYAFPDRNNGIVPVVGVDGWARIINEAPQFDGMSFEQDDDKCTCTIYRKDRAHPIAVTEYMTECKRDAQPWRSHPRRMLRHKAMIQCARIAFGFVGIYDQDEAERTEDAEATHDQSPPSTTRDAIEAFLASRQWPSQRDRNVAGALLADFVPFFLFFAEPRQRCE